MGKATGVYFQIIDAFPESDGAKTYGKMEYDAEGKPVITISMESKNIVSTAFHELTHWMKDVAPAEWERYSDYVMKWMEEKNQTTTEALIQEYMERYGLDGFETDRAKAIEEIVCDASEAMLDDKNAVFDFADRNRGIAQKIVDFFTDLFETIRNYISAHGKATDIGRALSQQETLVRDMRDLWVQAFDAAVENNKTGATKNAGRLVGEVRNSFEGYAEDGRGKYKSNFPKGTPKFAKSQKVLKYIQNVWSKNPIRLKIEENNRTKYIEAQFDPSYDETGNTYSDATKLMGGNRHGTAAEQRVTLDLANDYYQLAKESHYNYSKDETGKKNAAHNDVLKWHYFVNDIYFAEYDSDDYAPYRVSINIKERADGSFVYSFSAEKEKLDTPQTLHAAVNDGKKSNANVQLNNPTISQDNSAVNTQYMQDSEKNNTETSSASENLRRSISDVGKVDLSTLQKENDRLRQANAHLKEQFKLTQGKKPDRNAVKKLCRKILRE